MIAMGRILHIFTILSLVGASLQAPTAQDPLLDDPAEFRRKPLTFTDDGRFQVSIFEDLHFGESKLCKLRALSLPTDLTVKQTRGILGALSKTSTVSKSSISC